jgi:hypothetical protein
MFGGLIPNSTSGNVHDAALGYAANVRLAVAEDSLHNKYGLHPQQTLPLW